MCVANSNVCLAFTLSFHYLSTSVVSAEKSCFYEGDISSFSGSFKIFLFVFGLPLFEHNVPRCGFIFVLLWIHWAPCICELISFISFGNFSLNISSDISS